MNRSCAAIARLLLCVCAFAASRAHALTALSLQMGCNWMQAVSDTNGATGLPDEDAKYYIAFMPTSPPPGATVEVEGRFPQVRFFGFTIYQNLGRPVDWLSDYQLQTLEGHPQDPDRADIPYSNGYLDHYRMSVRFEDKPAQPAANSVYTGAYLTPTNSILLIRYYYPNPGADILGNTELPVLSYVAPDGTRTPLSQNPNPFQCNLLKTLLPIPFIASPPVIGVALPKPAFKIISYNSPLSTAPYPNPVGGYARALTDRKRDDMVIIRYKRPAMPVSPFGVDADQLTGAPPGTFGAADLRYLSVCQTTLQFTTTVACASDQELVAQDDGYVSIIISAERPAIAPADYNWLPWGKYPQALVLMRQILAREGFQGDFQTASLTPDPNATLGEWNPEITYCDLATFGANLANGGGATFQACKTYYEAHRLANYRLGR